jgi:prepilin-type N-terminal cleavage/methylation domain-containing protein
VPNSDPFKPRDHEGKEIIADCKGFTLLEVMIALLLLVVIMTTSVSMLFLNIKGWESVSEASEDKITTHLVSARIEYMLRNLIPLTWQDRQSRYLAFSGDEHHVQFIAPAPQQYQSGGLFEYRLAQQHDSQQGLNLVLDYAPYYPQNRQFSLSDRGRGRRRILFTGLERIEFSFFGQLQPGSESEWVSRWSQNNRDYPELIRISHVALGRSGSKVHVVRVRRDRS